MRKTTSLDGRDGFYWDAKEIPPERFSTRRSFGAFNASRLVLSCKLFKDVLLSHRCRLKVMGLQLVPGTNLTRAEDRPLCPPPVQRERAAVPWPSGGHFNECKSFIANNLLSFLLFAFGNTTWNLLEIQPCKMRILAPFRMVFKSLKRG